MVAAVADVLLINQDPRCDRVPDMRAFFRLTTPIGRAFGPRDFGGHSRDEIEQYSRGEARPATPVRLTWGRGGGTPSDAIWITVRGLVASPRLLGVLVRFTGWTTYPVEVIDKSGAPVEGYSGIAITGRCGAALYDRSRIERSLHRIGTDYIGLYFDLESWDGTDLFYPSVGPGPIVAANLAKALRKSKISNVFLEALPNVRASTDMVDRWMDSLDPPIDDAIRRS